MQKTILWCVLICGCFECEAQTNPLPTQRVQRQDTETLVRILTTNSISAITRPSSGFRMEEDVRSSREDRPVGTSTNGIGNSGLARLYAIPKLPLRSNISNREKIPNEANDQSGLDLATLKLASDENTSKPASDSRATFTSDLNARPDADALETHHWLVENGYLRPAVPQSKTRFGRALDNIFEPAPIHFRKVDVSFSIVTAIKKRNPLCLLNPYPFIVSW